MFIILLKLVDTSKIADNMPGHNAWLKQGFDDGVFMLAGTIEPKRGGAILAHNISPKELDKRIAADPFVKAGIASAEILDITPARADEHLAFLVK